MHHMDKITPARLPAILATAFLGLCLLLPATAQAYGGGRGSTGETDKPENNRVFDDERPGAPEINYAGDPSFSFDPAAIPDKSGESFWESDECIGMLTVLDVSGSIACFFIPGYGWFKAVHFAGKAYAFAIDENKQKKAWGVLSWIGQKSGQAYDAVKDAASGMYSRVKGALSGPTSRSPGGVGTGNTANK